MADKRRYKLNAPHYLNGRYLEAGQIILWPSDQASQMMVEVDSRGQEVTKIRRMPVPEVKVLEVQAPVQKPDEPPLTPMERADMVQLAVRDVLTENADSYFTRDGSIRMDVVREKSKIPDVTRDEINAAIEIVQAAGSGADDGEEGEDGGEEDDGGEEGDGDPAEE